MNRIVIRSKRRPGADPVAVLITCTCSLVRKGQFGNRRIGQQCCGISSIQFPVDQISVRFVHGVPAQDRFPGCCVVARRDRWDPETAVSFHRLRALRAPARILGDGVIVGLFRDGRCIVIILRGPFQLFRGQLGPVRGGIRIFITRTAVNVKPCRVILHIPQKKRRSGYRPGPDGERPDDLVRRQIQLQHGPDAGDGTGDTAVRAVRVGRRLVHTVVHPLIIGRLGRVPVVAAAAARPALALRFRICCILRRSDVGFIGANFRFQRQEDGIVTDKHFQFHGIRVGLRLYRASLRRSKGRVIEVKTRVLFIVLVIPVQPVADGGIMPGRSRFVLVPRA